MYDIPSWQSNPWGLGGLTRLSVVCAWLVCASCFPDPEEATVPVFSSRLSLLNRTHELMEVDVTPLVNHYDDCPDVQAHPARLLMSAFDRSRTSTAYVGSGQEIAVDPNDRQDIFRDYGDDYYGGYEDYYYSDCQAYLIEVKGLSSIVAFLPQGQQRLGYKTFMLDADVPQDLPSDVQTIELNADYSKILPTGKKHTWRQRVCESMYPAQCTEPERDAAAERQLGATYSWGQSKGQRLYEAIDNLPKEDASCRLNDTWTITSIAPVLRGVISEVRVNGRCQTLYAANGSDPLEFAEICFDDDSLRETLRPNPQAPMLFLLEDELIGLTRRVKLELSVYDESGDEDLVATYVFSEGYTAPPYTSSQLNPTCRADQTTCGWASVGLDTFLGAPGDEPLPVRQNTWTPNPDGWDVHLLESYQHLLLNGRCDQLYQLSADERRYFSYVRRRLIQ